MALEYADEFFKHDGIRLHYQDWGIPGNPVILMVHGLTRNSHAFDGVAEKYYRKFRCIAVDIRGRGRSDWCKPADYNFSRYLGDISILLEMLGLKQVHWLGTSMGGQIALHMAAQRPELFLSLVLNDIGPEVAAEGSQRIQDAMEQLPASFSTWSEAIAYEAARFPWIKKISLREQEAEYRWSIRRNEARNWVFHYDPQVVAGRATTPAQRAKAEETQWAGLKALTCPILLVRGAESDLLAVETAEKMQDAKPDMAFVTIPEVGHALSLKEEKAAQALKIFYGGLR